MLAGSSFSFDSPWLRLEPADAGSFFIGFDFYIGLLFAYYVSLMHYLNQDNERTYC